MKTDAFHERTAGLISVRAASVTSCAGLLGHILSQMQPAQEVP